MSTLYLRELPYMPCSGSFAKAVPCKERPYHAALQPRLRQDCLRARVHQPRAAADRRAGGHLRHRHLRRGRPGHRHLRRGRSTGTCGEGAQVREQCGHDAVAAGAVHAGVAHAGHQDVPLPAAARAPAWHASRRAARGPCSKPRMGPAGSSMQGAEWWAAVPERAVVW